MLISWSEEDQAYIVSVPELPGCMADGKISTEAVENAEIIIQEWIETALEDGEEIPEPHLFSVPVIDRRRYILLYNKKLTWLVRLLG